MESTTTYWAQNLKLLRKRKALSQDELSEILGITRSKLNSHENGGTINPPVEDLIRFSSYYRLSIDSLIKLNLQKLGELKIRELESGNDHYTSGTKLRVLATTVDGDNNENIEYVPVKAKAGYVAGYNDPEFIATLPRFTMPQLPASRTYRMFPTSGKSMLPIPEGSLVIAEYVQDWMSIKDGTLCILILKSAGQDFVFKELHNNIKKGRSILLISLNDEFKPYEVPVSDVLEIWKFVSFVSETVPTGDITMSRIADSLREIKVDVARLGRA